MEFFKDMQDVNWRYCAFYIRLQWHRLSMAKRALLVAAVGLSIYVIVGINHGMRIAADEFPVTSLEGTLSKTMTRLKTCPVRESASANLQLSGYKNVHSFTFDEIVHKYELDREKETLVFLHIQKTSGSNFLGFLKEAVGNGLFIKDLDVRKDRSCGMHMDFSRMTHCVSESQWTGERKRPLVLTMLRDPAERYVSEWLNLKSGNNWMPTMHHCGCAQCQDVHVPQCLLKARLSVDTLQKEQLKLQMAGRQIMNKVGDWAALQNATILLQRWTSLSFEDFLGCHDNDAANRQVRMLSDHDKCSTGELFLPESSGKFLDRAKENLKEMAFFGLTEYQKETQNLFYKTFGYQSVLEQNVENHASCLEIPEHVSEQIKKMNSADYELYNYAKDLFFQRLKAFGLE